MLSVLAEPDARAKLSDLPAGGSDDTRFRLGVAGNVADEEVMGAFRAAVETLRALGHPVAAATAPPDIPRLGDLRTIEADREAVSERAFTDIDVLLLPTLAATVPTVNDARGNPQALSAANTMFANYFGLPAISVPCGFDARGLPLGLQMVGRPWGDALVLRLAQQYERSTRWAALRPSP
jgi:aspartyl-tRNA(Asn)/glutamyl-tRNA(Gln) amidotransferase subunit A